MGGKSPSQPKPVSTAPPTPVVDENANADNAAAGATPNSATLDAAKAEEDKPKQGTLGSTSGTATQAKPKKARDAASITNGTQSNALGSSAILTG